MLAKKLGNGLSMQHIGLIFNGKGMVDPMSFCDHSGVTAPVVDVDVKLSK